MPKSRKIARAHDRKIRYAVREKLIQIWRTRGRNAPSWHLGDIVRAIRGCPLMARSGHADHLPSCPLSGVKRTLINRQSTSIYECMPQDKAE